MEEDEYNDIVTYIQDQKYPHNANESIKKSASFNVLVLFLFDCPFGIL
jgi:hypothetical protein